MVWNQLFLVLSMDWIYFGYIDHISLFIDETFRLVKWCFIGFAPIIHVIEKIIPITFQDIPISFDLFPPVASSATVPE